MDEYGALLNSIVKIRAKYLGTLVLASVMVPSILVSKFYFKSLVLLYLYFAISASAFIFYRIYFLRESINYNNVNLSYFNFKNVITVESKSLVSFALNAVNSLAFFSIIGKLYFSSYLHFLDEPKKHQLPAVNPYFIYYYSFAIANGLFNTFYSLWFNENIVSIDFTQFHSSPKDLLKRHITVPQYVNLLQKYAKALVVFIVGFEVSFNLLNISQSISSWASMVMNVSAVNDSSFFSLSVLFYSRLIIFSIFLKLVTFTISYSLFNSYILLGSLHFNQPISSYFNSNKSSNNNDAANLKIIFNSLQDTNKDQLAKITGLQELGLLVLDKKSKLFKEFLPFYNDYVQHLELILKANIDQLSTKTKAKVQKKKDTVSKNATMTAEGANKVNFINDKDVFKKSRTSFFWTTLDSISLKFVLLLQDKNSTESFYIINFAKQNFVALVGALHYARNVAFKYLNIDSVEQNPVLEQAILLHYYLYTFTLIVNNSSADKKLHNKILSNVDRILDILQQSIMFCENYCAYYKIPQLSTEDAKKLFYNAEYDQYSNQFLVLHLHSILKNSFLELISKYQDILNELNLSPDVLTMSKKVLSEYNIKSELNSKNETQSDHNDSSNDFTTFNVSVNY